MRAIVQRVHSAVVVVDGQAIGQIGPGLLVYVGVAHSDDDHDLAYLVEKVTRLRIFPDSSGRMNLDVTQMGGQVLVVSAFTLQADSRKGRRPTLDGAAPPVCASPLVDRFCAALESSGVVVQRGRFGATMDVQSVNAGPVCLLLDSRRVF